MGDEYRLLLFRLHIYNSTVQFDEFVYLFRFPLEYQDTRYLKSSLRQVRRVPSSSRNAATDRFSSSYKESTKAAKFSR